jgi:hypothetical protein
MKALFTMALLALTMSASAQSDESMLGCWEMKSRDGEKLQLMRNGEFHFHDYNTKKGGWDDLYGSWDYVKGKLTLLYSDRSKQTFTVQKKGNAVSLTKVGGFLFTKAAPSDCEI